MKTFWIAAAMAVALGITVIQALPTFAQSTTAVKFETKAKPAMSPSAKVLAAMKSRNDEHSFNAFLTGYSYWDNTPPGSAAISKPVVHRRAGGTGKYHDPITIAVGHTIIGSRQTLDFKPGTKFYIKRLRKYAIVEDVCGDGRQPQNGPCHTGYKGHPWLDIYVGGGKSNAKYSAACARKLTAVQQIIINPRPDYPVEAGEIVRSGCRVFNG